MRMVRRFALAVMLLVAFTVACVADSETTPDYANIDLVASQIAASSDVTVNAVVKSLTELCKNDAERARAAYSFTASYMSYSANEGISAILEPDVPLSKIFNGKGMCGEYAKLFNMVASKMGLEVVTIIGVAKGEGYRVGETASNYPHAWNAVKIGEDWKLLDCAWGSGRRTTQSGDTRPEYQHRIDNAYFFVPPERLKYTHFPRESKWQMLGKLMTEPEFLALPVLKPEFFDNHLVLTGAEDGVLKQSTGAMLECSVPDGVCVFARLYDSSGTMLPPSLVLAQRENGRLVVRAAAPSGVSFLRLCALRSGIDEKGLCVAEFRVENTDIGSVPGVFPQTFKGFEQGDASVANPIQGTLYAGTVQEFKLTVPRAESVAVLQGNAWSNLKRSADGFSGSVKLLAGEARVMAKYPSETSFSTLLKYQVADKPAAP